jgi:hypothetical protein
MIFTVARALKGVKEEFSDIGVKNYNIQSFNLERRLVGRPGLYGQYCNLDTGMLSKFTEWRLL